MLCAKVNTWEVDAKRVWDGASPEVQDIMVGAIGITVTAHKPNVTK